MENYNGYNNHQFNDNPNDGYRGGNTENTELSSYRPPADEAGRGLAMAALILGIFSIVTSFLLTLTLPFILGGLAILLAILSKGRAHSLKAQAKGGIACGIVGIIINIIVISVVFALFGNYIIDETRDIYNNIMEEFYENPYQDSENPLDAIMDEFL